jgi:hypothetical protein
MQIPGVVKRLTSVQSKSVRSIALLGIAGLFAVVGGAWAVRAELAPFLTARESSMSRILELAGGGTDAGLSIQAQQLLLFDCRNAIGSLVSQLQTTEVRDGLFTNCLARSDEIAAAAPSFSMAWASGAVAAAALKDWAGFNMRLHRSYLSGATEQWIADMRVDLAERNLDQLDEQTRADHEADLRMLVGTSNGLRSLARRYLAEPSFRERITGLVDTMSQDDKARFVNAVQKAGREMRRQ